EGASFQRSAVSVQLLQQRGQHAFQFGGAWGQSILIGGSDQLQVSGQQEVIFQLAGGSHRDGTEAGELGISIPPASLSQVRRDRRARAAEFTGKSVYFARKG